MTTRKITTFLMHPASTLAMAGGTPQASGDAGRCIKKTTWVHVADSALEALGVLLMEGRLVPLVHTDSNHQAGNCELDGSGLSSEESRSTDAGNDEESGGSAVHSGHLGVESAADHLPVFERVQALDCDTGLQRYKGALVGRHAARL